MFNLEASPQITRDITDLPPSIFNRSITLFVSSIYSSLTVLISYGCISGRGLSGIDIAQSMISRSDSSSRIMTGSPYSLLNALIKNPLDVSSMGHVPNFLHAKNRGVCCPGKIYNANGMRCLRPN